MASDSFDSGGVITDVIDSVAGVDTGNMVTSPEIITWDNPNQPSVINNFGTPDDSTLPAPDFSFPGANSTQDINALNDIVNSEVSSANATYNPFDLGQMAALFGDLLGVDGPTQVNNSPKPSNSKSANGATGSSMGNALASAAKAALPTGASGSKPVTPTQSPSTDALSKFLLGNPSNNTTSPTGLNWNNLATILTIVTSIIIIWLFLKKGHT